MPSVVSRDRQPRMLGEFLFDFGRRREHRRHRSAAGKFAHQSPALGDQPQTGFQIEHAGRVRRRVLPDAVPGDDVGAHSATDPKIKQRRFDSEQRRLRPFRLVDLARSAGRLFPQHFKKRFAANVLQDFLATIERSANDRLSVIKRLGHSQKLRTLTGEEKRDRTRRRTRFQPFAGSPFQEGG